MSAKSESIVKSLLESIKSPSKETQPYDTSATVTRVEDDTVFVHIPGGVAETPCSKTINCKVGDTVQVRVGGGKAWLVGNVSAPPTDDTTANTAIRKTNQLGDSLTKLQKIAGNTDQYFWHVETGEDTGSHITEIPKERFLEAPALGGGNLLLRSNGIAIRNGLNELATFSGSAIQFNQPGTSTVVATIGTSGLYIQKGIIKIGNKQSATDTSNTGFYVDVNGNVACSNLLAHGGTIGGWTIGGSTFYSYADNSGHVSSASSALQYIYIQSAPGTNLGNSAIAIQSRASTSDSWVYQFYLTHAGYLYARNANIQGTINASAGKIGGWDLSANTLSSTTYGVGSIRSAYSETAVFIENGEVKFKNSYSASSNTYLLNSEGVWGYFYVNDRLYCNNTFVTDGQLHLGTAYNSNVHVSCVWSDNGWHDIITRNGSSNDVYIGGANSLGFTTNTYIRGTNVKLQGASGNTITSDRNVKKDIATYDSKYDDFYDALNPITYKFIHGTSGRTHSGFISQDVRDALISSGLSTTEFGGYIRADITHREIDTDGQDVPLSDTNYLLDHDINEIHELIYSEFIALNTWQIQKLKARVAELEARLNG